MCGGTGTLVEQVFNAGGLSPRVRGNHMTTPQLQGIKRSIPACAGEPRPGNWLFELHAVYPRVCGGTSIKIERDVTISGLSPRVRGNPACFPTSPGPLRSIPACAGEPTRRAGLWQRQGVYPRVCGGTTVPVGTVTYPRGLSPRVRGNRGDRPHLAQQHRSIPACAGEPTVTSSSANVYRVYPRVCGGTRRAIRKSTLL